PRPQPPNAGAISYLTLTRPGPTQEVQQPLDNMQPQPGAAILACHSFFDLAKGLENNRHRLRGNANPCVAHTHLYSPSCGICLHRDAPLRSELHSVANEIAEHDFQLVRVRVDGDKPALDSPPKVQPRVLIGFLALRLQLLEHGGHLSLSDRHRQAPRLQPAHLQHGNNEPEEVARIAADP